MENLPSYEEAVSRPDWLGLVAPFVPSSSWRQCCLVNRRFYYQFAPRLWQDPLVIVRELGLDPNDGKREQYLKYPPPIHPHSAYTRHGSIRPDANRQHLPINEQSIE